MPRIHIYISDDELALLDELRGRESRASFVRFLIERERHPSPPLKRSDVKAPETGRPDVKAPPPPTIARRPSWKQ